MKWLVLAVVGALACSATTGPTAPGDEDYVGRDAQVELAQLRFRGPAERERFMRVHACFAAKAGPGWRHYPLRKIGNFVEENWCRGAHDRGCMGGSFRSDPGDEWAEVSTLHYDRDWPEVFGLNVGAGKLPAADGWGVSFSYSRDGARIIGEGFGFSFHRIAGGEIAQELHAGHSHVYKIEETQISVRGPGTFDEELARLIASPESLQATIVARLDALAVEVERQLAGDLVRKCVYGPYEGGGVPPLCTPTPLTAAERAAASTAARAEIDARRAAVTDNAALFHRLIAELMAFDRCW